MNPAGCIGKKHPRDGKSEIDRGDIGIRGVARRDAFAIRDCQQTKPGAVRRRHHGPVVGKSERIDSAITRVEGGNLAVKRNVENVNRFFSQHRQSRSVVGGCDGGDARQFDVSIGQ